MLDVYNALIENGKLLPDPAQANAAAQLSAILVKWEESGRKRSFPHFFKKMGETAPQGIYLWGDVGRGKSLLMDMFYDAAPIAPKRRAHYHAFMLDIHARIHRLRQDAATHDPLPPLAQALAKETRFLCLDELQVTDVADAMILGRLFTALLDHGVRIAFTSNRKPDDLYLHGLQRERFLVFIALIHSRLQVTELASAEDYRLRQLRALHETYLTGNGAARMDAAFSALTQGAAPESSVVDVQGHCLALPTFHSGVARFSFADLCAKPLGAGDYEYIAQRFATVLVDDIPLLSPEKRNEAKRFVTLIDTLYEHKVKLVCSAAAPPEKLYPSGDGSFEFARTVSRLMEMQSETYLAAGHKVA